MLYVIFDHNFFDKNRFLFTQILDDFKTNLKTKQFIWHSLGPSLYELILCRAGLVVSVSASHMVGRGFASQRVHTKHHHKNGTNCLLAQHAMGKHWSLAVQPDCLKGRVVCGTVYGDIHLKDLVGSFVRVGYRIPVLDFYLVPHGRRCRKSTKMNQSIIKTTYNQDQVILFVWIDFSLIFKK